MSVLCGSVQNAASSCDLKAAAFSGAFCRPMLSNTPCDAQRHVGTKDALVTYFMRAQALNPFVHFDVGTSHILLPLKT